MKVPYVPLGEIICLATVVRARTQEPPILSMTMADGLVDQASKFKKRIASADLSTYKVIRRGQLVVGFPIDEGVLSFQDLYDEAIVSPAYTVWDLVGRSQTSRKYLERFLRSPSALSFYKSKLRSTTARRRTVPTDVFLSLPVPVPPLGEQERIEAILDQADSLRRLRQRAIDRLNSLGQAIFFEMFGDPAMNPRRRPSGELGSLITTGPQNGLYKPASMYGQGTPILRIDAFYDGRVTKLGELKRLSVNANELSTYALQPDDIVINRVNSTEYLGKSAVIPALSEPTVFESNMMRFRVDE